MKRFVLRWLAAGLLTAASAGVAFGQGGARPPTPSAEASGAESSHGQPVFQYFVVVASTILILFIVCKPSRKAQ
jgi:hypothetical protein